MDDKKRTTLLIVFSIFAALAMIAIGTYAWFSASIQGNDTASSLMFKASDIGQIDYVDGNEINIKSFMPNQYVEKTFTILSSENDIAISYNLYLDIYENSFLQVYSNELTYSLTHETYDGQGIPVSDAIGEITPNIPSSETATTINLGNGILAVGSDSITYKLRISFNEMNQNQASNMGKKLYAKIRVSNTITYNP